VETPIRAFCGIFAISPKVLADAFGQCRGYGHDVPEEKTTEEYWTPRLVQPWLETPGFWYTGEAEGYGIPGKENPEWIGMTEEEFAKVVRTVQIYHRYFSLLPPEEIEFLLQPRWRPGGSVGELDPAWQAVYRVLGGDYIARTLLTAYAAIRSHRVSVQPEYAGRRKKHEASLAQN